MDKFSVSLYDVLAYLVPGTILLLIFNLALHWTYAVGIPFTPGSQWVGAVIFVVASYFLGHLLQGFANHFEGFLFRCWGGWPSERLVADPEEWAAKFQAGAKSCKITLFVSRGISSFIRILYSTPSTRRLHYSTQLATRIRSSAESYFNLECGYSSQELFNLCYSTIMAKSIPSLIPVINAFYSLYRGMAAACLLGMIVTLVGAVAGKGLPIGNLVTISVRGTFLLSLLLLLGTHVFIGRLRRFAEHFADNVYRTFYIFLCDKQTHP